MDMEVQRLDRFAVERITTYGEYVINQRALVDFRDGLKPVQRRILWSMHTMGISATSNFQKSAKIVGTCMGNFHPHGNSGIYSAMVTMVNNPHSALKGMGNWGRLNEQPAADRYTEVKMSPYGQQNFFNPQYIPIVEYEPTYDGSDKEPVFLPSLLPNVLLNGAEGIAVGVVGNIPPFQLKGVISLVEKAISGDVSAKDCAKLLRLNYPYGNNLEDVEKLKLFFTTGESTIKILPTYEMDGPLTIVLKDVPPHFKDSTVTERLMNLKMNKIDIVKQAVNYSDSKINYVVHLMPSIDDSMLNAAIDRVINTIANSITLRAWVTHRKQDNIVPFSAPMPKYIKMWADWRIELERKSIRHQQKKVEDAISATNLLILACKHLDIIFPILKSSNKPVDDLQSSLKINKEQAETIMRFTLNSLSKLNAGLLKERKEKMVNQVKQLESDFKTPEPIILSSLEALRKK
jgi:DNA gyrase/topoisomerase IV subunit A